MPHDKPEPTVGDYAGRILFIWCAICCLMAFVATSAWPMAVSFVLFFALTHWSFLRPGPRFRRRWP